MSRAESGKKVAHAQMISEGKRTHPTKRVDTRKFTDKYTLEVSNSQNNFLVPCFETSRKTTIPPKTSVTDITILLDQVHGRIRILHYRLRLLSACLA
jgi:hypothetical protein